MIKGLPTAKVVLFRATRRMPTTHTDKAVDPSYWAAQVDAIATRRDVSAFMRIYDHFGARLQRYLVGLLKNQEVAEELMQEAMLRVWTRAESFDVARSNFSTWLFRIARNLYIDRLRSEPHWCAIQEGIERLDQESDCAGLSPAESFHDEMQLLGAIHALPAMHARLIRMSYLESKSHSEIAAELGMPLGSVKSTLRRAFGKLQLAMRSAP